MNPAKHALQISIFTKNEEHIFGVAKAVDQLWEEGILPHMDWKWIEKQFKVNCEECIENWRIYLSMQDSL